MVFPDAGTHTSLCQEYYGRLVREGGNPGTRYFSGLFSPGRGEPVHSFRYGNFEPGTFAR
jgi:hypothetical protein